MFEDKTIDALKNEILNNIDLPLAKNEGSVLNMWASGSAVIHAAYYNVLEHIYKTAFIVDLENEMLDKRLADFGYTRKEGTYATGYVTFKAPVGTIIDDGITLLANGIRYNIAELQNGLIEDENVGVTLVVVCEQQGKVGNLNANANWQIENNDRGITEVFNQSELKGGVDAESDDDFKTRFFYSQKYKGTSGNVYDYINWALEVDGVSNARVIPLWAGNGTVKVVVTAKNNKNVNSDVLNKAREYIESMKPVGASVTVVTPSLVDITISATVEIDDRISLQSVKEAYSDSVSNYLSEEQSEITYNKLSSLLMSVEGVVDYSNFTLNNGTSNIKLTDEQCGNIANIELVAGVVE